MMVFLYMGLTLVAFGLGGVFGYKRATQYRKSPLFQYAVLVARTAPEEWKQLPSYMTGYSHPEFGDLYMDCRIGGVTSYYFDGVKVSSNYYNQLRNAIVDEHCKIKMRQRTERLKGEMKMAVDQMNARTISPDKVNRKSLLFPKPEPPQNAKKTFERAAV